MECNGCGAEVLGRHCKECGSCAPDGHYHGCDGLPVYMSDKNIAAYHKRRVLFENAAIESAVGKRSLVYDEALGRMVLKRI